MLISGVTEAKKEGVRRKRGRWEMKEGEGKLMVEGRTERKKKEGQRDALIHSALVHL